MKSREMKNNTKRNITIEDDPSVVSGIIVESRNTADSLKEAQRAERRHSDHFLKYLENAVKDGEMDTSTSSLGVFEPVTDRRKSLPAVHRKSDVDLFDESPPGKKRRGRLSEVYCNDPVMMYVPEPSLDDNLNNSKDTIRSELQQSDLFTKRLQLILQSQSDIF